MTEQTNEQRISSLEAEIRRIHDRISSLARLSQGDVADLKSDIAMLRAEMASNHAAVVKELAHLGSELDALPRAIAEPISELIATEIGKASARNEGVPPAGKRQDCTTFGWPKGQESWFTGWAQTAGAARRSPP